MKLKIKLKKIMAAFILIMIIGSAFIGNFNSVYGRINGNYSQGASSGTIDIEQASSDSTILDAIGHFVYAIAGFIESIVGKIIGSFTGDDIFPWADRIIFNTIPFLDVNFLSPSNGSMFRNSSGTNTMFGNIIGNIYYTIFTLAIAFFGVVVGIMAMRLAISSIASEKAKYKQAITNWLLALILLFTTHYLISFIFFVNEKMVEVASSVFKAQIEENQDEINLDFSVEYDQETLDSLFMAFFKLYYQTYDPDFGPGEDVYIMPISGSGGYFGDSRVDVVDDERIYTYRKDLIKLATNGTDDGNFNWKFYRHSGKVGNVQVTYENSGNKFNFNGNGGWNWENTSDAAEGEVDTAFEQKFKIYLHALMSNSTYIEEYRAEISDAVNSTTGWFHQLDFGDQSALRDMRRIVNDALFLTNYDSELLSITGLGTDVDVDRAIDAYVEGAYELEEYLGGYYDQDTNYPDSLKSLLKRVHSAIDKNATDTINEEEEIISNLADYFKETIYISSIDIDYDYEEEEELVNIEFQPIVAILYAIFVIQSIMYFIAYIKRFFYIVVLALFAPLVIIYDFLMKTAMG